MDAIGRAIRGSAPTEVKVVTIRINLSTGRPVAMLVPADMTVQENLDLAAFVTSGLGNELVRQRQPASKLTVARGPLPRA
jgi:hypothetical protein